MESCKYFHRLHKSCRYKISQVLVLRSQLVSTATRKIVWDFFFRQITHSQHRFYRGAQPVNGFFDNDRTVKSINLIVQGTSIRVDDIWQQPLMEPCICCQYLLEELKSYFRQANAQEFHKVSTQKKITIDFWWLNFCISSWDMETADWCFRRSCWGSRSVPLGPF